MLCCILMEGDDVVKCHFASSIAENPSKRINIMTRSYQQMKIISRRIGSTLNILAVGKQASFPTEK